MKPETKPRQIITDKLVVAQTGKTMEEWFVHFDKKGAKKCKHEEIFNLVSKTKGLENFGQWNQNLLTTSYEWNRGLKERGEKADGFEISVSKTINVPVNKLYAALIDDKLRKKWLGEKIVFRKTTENKSARITWSDGETSLSVDFYVKGESKSQIVVQHLKLPDSRTAEKMKAYWGEALKKMSDVL